MNGSEDVPTASGSPASSNESKSGPSETDDKQAREQARLHAIATGIGIEGRNGLFLNRKVPLEIFIRIAELVTEPDVNGRIDEAYTIDLTHVCTAWRKVLLDCPQIWSKLELAIGGDYSPCAKAEAWASRAKSLLRDISFFVWGTTPLCDNDDYDDLDADHVDDFDLFVELSTLHLDTFSLIARDLIRLPAAALIANMPSIAHLDAKTLPQAVEGGLFLPAFFQQTLPTAMSPALRQLELTGLSLEAFQFPTFSHLASVTFTQVHVPNLFGFLKSCASTLVDLVLSKITTSPPSNFLPNELIPDQKDLPGTLVLPILKRFKCLFKQAAMFWTTPRLTSSTFVMESPSLHTVSFESTNAFYDDARIVPTAYFETESLSTFFRHSPRLTTVDLSSLDVNSDTLLASLEHVISPTLMKVRLGTLGSDTALDKLHTFMPNLRYLDVVGTGGGSLATLPALARFADRMQVLRHASEWRLDIVAKRPVTSDETLNQLRIALKTKLLALTSSQVSHLTMSLRLNSPPNGLGFAVVKQEIVSMSTPPEPPMASKCKKKKKKETAAPLPASQAIVNEAATAMKKWQARREDDWAIDWFKQTPHVELHWSDTKPWRANE
ncbi:hypothetical protein OIV83_002009 [Microbotryomycetes sp. JL201]|nr:hypothetical protein OIV83_002009 [Microbotryomycetes sp. JL201]